MNYIGRKDGGKYITSNKEVESFDGDLLVPIGYSKEVADFARETRLTYRKAFIESMRAAKTETNG